MPYLEVDLDAFKGAQLAAGVLGLPVPQVIGGLNLLWAHAWQRQEDHVSAVVLEGLFASPHPRLGEALEAGGFLEGVGDLWRVRGSERYLRIAEARRKGALATNAKRALERRSSVAPASLERRSTPSHRSTDSPTHRSKKDTPPLPPQTLPADAGARASESAPGAAGDALAEAPELPGAPRQAVAGAASAPLGDDQRPPGSRGAVAGRSSLLEAPGAVYGAQVAEVGATLARTPDLPGAPAEAQTRSVASLRALWLELAVPAGLPGWSQQTSARRLAAARQRLRERPIEGAGGWREVIARIAASDFCRGAGNRGWRATPDWLLRPETAPRVLEGQYDDGRPGAAATAPTSRAPAPPARAAPPPPRIQSAAFDRVLERISRDQAWPSASSVLVPVGENAEELVVFAPNAFVRDWLEDQEELAAIAGKRLRGIVASEEVQRSTTTEDPCISETCR